MRRRQHMRVPGRPASAPASAEPLGLRTAPPAAEPLGRIPAPAVAEPLVPNPVLVPNPAPVPNPALPPGALGDPADVEREAGVARLFELHYSSMLRLAVLLGADDPENVVAEAYYQIYRKWRRLRDAEAAEAYLRSTVCNLTRMRIRHLQVARKHVEAPAAQEPVASAESTALLHDDQRVLIGALQQLPARQREALVLRHWLGLKESEIAAAMGISCGSVKTHTARGLAALTQAMEARR
ncbi:SigE family RNA polymerase sigma factor [Streptomyces sp. NPDC057474]|uniref:SigE family RNA polymerase sigma factor n=1 Tax=Streptomyces sp. NPDC057474 TaxID=3346144 RepID=UPI0036A05274